MPTGVWSKRLYYVDPNLPIVELRTDSRKEWEYYFALGELLKTIHDNISPVMNFAHLKSTYPRANLPLRFEGMHMDVAYLTYRETLVQAQVHVTPKRRIPAKYLGAGLSLPPTPGE